MLELTSEISISSHELLFQFARSSGPGGQNVNKVNSKAILRWNPGENVSLPYDIRSRILTHLAAKLTRTGDLLISSDRFRDQRRNQEDCLLKLRELLLPLIYPPKKRKPTAPTYSSRLRKKSAKKHASDKKKNRSRPNFD